MLARSAVQMNILIVRAFLKLREVLATQRDLARKIDPNWRKPGVGFHRKRWPALRTTRPPGH
jgi:hypothetical protein